MVSPYCHIMRSLPKLLVVALCAACSAPDPGIDAETLPDASGAPVALVVHDVWQPVSSSADPFEDRPAVVECEQGSGWAAEQLDGVDTLGVDMHHCNYFVASQPLIGDVAAGDTIGIRAWHYALTGSGEAHLALQIGDERLFERRIPIPADSQLIVQNVVAPRAFSVGERVLFHAHNHGDNSYNLIDVVRGSIE